MAFHVYVLRSLRDGKTYTGSTDDLDRRLSEHAQGHVKSTRNRLPFRLVYLEQQPTRSAALARERFFKTPEGGVLKQELLKDWRPREGEPGWAWAIRPFGQIVS